METSTPVKPAVLVSADGAEIGTIKVPIRSSPVLIRVNDTLFLRVDNDPLGTGRPFAYMETPVWSAPAEAVAV